MLPRSWRTAVGVLLAAAACSSPAHLPEAGPQGDRFAEPVLLPLLQPGRVLSFRGRSVLDLSAPDQAPAPRVGALFTRLRLLGQDGDTLRLSEESVKSYLARGRKLLRAAVGAAEKDARNPR